MTDPPKVLALATQISARRSALESYPAGRFTGDGIVVCAGGASIFTNAYVLIHVLRKLLGCALPIEVWHIGQVEMSARMRLLLRQLSAEPVDALPVMATRGVQLNDGWQLKSFALAESSFERALLLDADIVPERDPTELFGWPEFEAAGAVLWPDICSIVAENEIWAACGLTPRTTRAVESGQILVDKSRHWAALQLIVDLNTRSEDYYRMVYGDKDLFLMGFLLAGRPYRLVPHVPLTDQPWCLFQRDFVGERLFQHRTGAKWRYRGPQLEIPGFRYLAACEAALRELRSLWNGRVVNPPARSAAAEAREKLIWARRSAALLVPGENVATFDLLEGGEIIDQGVTGLTHWYCVGDSPVHLILCDRFERMMRFRPNGSDRWIQDGTPAADAAILIEGCGRRPDITPMPDKTWVGDSAKYRFEGDI